MVYLQDQVAIVTGSGRGIGKSIAIKLAQEGARVVINSRKRVDELENTLNEITALGGNAVKIMADVSTRAGCDAVIEEAVRKFGKIDILINNAGLGIYGNFAGADDRSIDKQLDTTLKSVIFCSQSALNYMKSGCIINISSLAGILPVKGLSIYSAAKAAVMSLTRSMALELAPNIRVNAIAPSVVGTKMGYSLLNAIGISEEQWIKNNTLNGALVREEDVAEAVMFLLKTPSIDGQTIILDSGQSIINGF